MRITRTLIVLLACASLVSGCGDKDEEDASAVALAIWKGMATGDGEAVAKHYDCSDADKAFLKESTQLMGKMATFGHAGAKKFGKDAWLAAAKKAGMEEMATSPIPDPAEMADKIECTIEEDKATCTLEGAEDNLVLIKKDGKWLAAADNLPTKDDREMAVGMMVKAVATACAKATAKMGVEGVTTEQVFAELKKAMNDAMNVKPAGT